MTKYWSKFYTSTLFYGGAAVRYVYSIFQRGGFYNYEVTQYFFLFPYRSASRTLKPFHNHLSSLTESVLFEMVTAGLK
ncbi:MAG: hypothetical protein ACXVB0_01615 [Mucilaginibacter sp.]